MKKGLTKKILSYAGIVLLFLVMAYSYTPQVLNGKIVNQSDIAAWKGMANEANTYNRENPTDETAWSNSMFGGMPTTLTIDDFDGDCIKPIYKALLLGKRPATYLFVTLLGAFLLMLSMGINGIVAVAGAVAVAFCSYNLQIIQVGHNTKMQAIAFMPWVLAGIIFTYRAALSGIKDDRKDWKKWLPKTVLGATLFALALSMQIKANHIQITYYLAIIIFVYALSLIISILKDEDKAIKFKRFLVASTLLLVVGCIGIATNSNKLIPIYEYSPYTMRGGSELSGSGTGHSNKGLDLDYATAWSYSIEEMPNLLIPNFNGGSSSGELDMDSETGKLLKRAGQPNLRQTLKHMPLYWGPQPFTAGPMYMGAISIFLFVLGLFLIKGRQKWWMVIATLIAIMLAWGNHFMWFTKLWFDYAPFYNKFRTVSMALIVLQVTLPLLGFYTLDRIIKEAYDRKTLMKYGFIAYALTAGFCLLCTIIPGIAGTFSGAVDAGQPDILIDALAADRQSLMTSDAWRSFLFISAVFGFIIWAFTPAKVDAIGKEGSFVRKGRLTIVAVVMVFVVWFDLATVGRRYLNKSHFITPKDFSAQYDLRPVDRMILEDTDPNYRVLDISVNTFNSSVPSFHHKTIGGYSPVKLQRYQDLIERYLNPEIKKVYATVGKSATIQEVSDSLPLLKATSLLNGKYVIIGEDYPPVVNHHAMGNAWFVSTVLPAATPDDEIAGLAKVDLGETAVIGNDFKWAQDKVAGMIPDETEDVIELTYYSPKELRFCFRTSDERAAIFSEIYYPKGWKAWIEPAGAYGTIRNGHYQPTADAKKIDLFRADWILRGAIIPQGEGQVIMRFEPDSYQIGKNISLASSIALILLLLASIAGIVLSSRKEEQ